MFSPNSKIVLTDGSEVTYVRAISGSQFITNNGRLIDFKDIVGVKESDIVLK